VIGFGGRILGSKDDGHGPKYLNSPETPIFSKGRELYGLFQAQAAIRKANRVLVVEGYMDVIALAQYGVEYVVATLGTATTEAHTQRLLRLADEVVFSFDGDAAGQRAAWRAMENALPALRDGKHVRFLFLPTEHDPDSYIREHGREAFEQFIDSALPLSQYWLRELNARHPGDSAEAKAARAAAARAHLELVSAPMMRESLAKSLEADVNISAHSLLPPVKAKPTEASTSESGFEARTQYVAKRPAMPRNDPAAQRAMSAARRILARPKLAMHLIDIALPDGLQAPALQPRPLRLLQAIVDVAIHLPDEPNHGAILERFRETEFASDVAQLLTHRDHELDAVMADEEIEQELRSLKSQIESGALFSSARAIEVPAHLANAGILALGSRRNGLPPPPFAPSQLPPSTTNESAPPDNTPPQKGNASRPATDDEFGDDIPFDPHQNFAPPPDDDHPPF
jgi:DNA primase